ncbi:MAG TPA: hypothetical protein VGO59_13405 [Verrucomicrobiae bacterium]|jgi:acyl carrier protein
MDDKVRNVVDGAIDRLNELMPAGGEVSKDPATVLLGQDGLLDSMGFINLVVALEEGFEKEFGRQVNLSDGLAAGAQPHTIADLYQALTRIAQSKKLLAV